MVRSIEALTRGLIDYAGLFPPAQLDMAPAVERYARYLHRPEASMLGRFICPASRLDELSEAAAALMPGTFATSGYREYADTTEPWRVSVVADLGLAKSLDAMDAFGARHSEEDAGLARADTVELRSPKPSEIDAAIDEIPDDVAGFFEIPWEGETRGYAAALAGDECFAKIRCGGVTADAFPSVEQIAEFLVTASQARVAFKATAGLHHPVRAEYALTYEDGAPRGVMHGFVNVFLAAAFAKAGAGREALVDVLSETDPAAFRFTDDHAAWKDHTIATDDLADARSRFALSYGSCSFEEPIDDLRGLGWL